MNKPSTSKKKLIKVQKIPVTIAITFASLVSLNEWVKAMWGFIKPPTSPLKTILNELASCIMTHVVVDDVVVKYAATVHNAQNRNDFIKLKEKLAAVVELVAQTEKTIDAEETLSIQKHSFGRLVTDFAVSKFPLHHFAELSFLDCSTKADLKVALYAFDSIMHDITRHADVRFECGVSKDLWDRLPDGTYGAEDETEADTDSDIGDDGLDAKTLKRLLKKSRLKENRAKYRANTEKRTLAPPLKSMKRPHLLSTCEDEFDLMAKTMDKSKYISTWQHTCFNMSTLVKNHKPA